MHIPFKLACSFIKLLFRPLIDCPFIPMLDDEDDVDEDVDKFEDEKDFS
jgi:hypothetical protein